MSSDTPIQPDVPERLRLVLVNAAFDTNAATPDALLDRYHTLTGLGGSLAAAGASVVVVQRFHTRATLVRDRVTYLFVTDAEGAVLGPGGASQAVADAVAAARPDVVHVNGLLFPQLVSTLRHVIAPGTAIIAQHHGGPFPSFGWGPVGSWRRTSWRSGLASADAVSFTSMDQAAPWREAGVIERQRVLDIVEAGTTMTMLPRDRARAASGLRGSPLLLWVGRLTSNKDPITVLDGLDLALPHIPDARVAMVYREDELHAQVSARIAQSDLLRDRVTRVGLVPHDQMSCFYSSADILVSGSRDEGSGYALVEAMACGVVPVVTDIPSFRAIAGPCGRRWTPGDPNALARALRELCASDLASAREAVRAQYERDLRWPAIAARTLSLYREVVDRRRPAGVV